MRAAWALALAAAAALIGCGGGGPSFTPPPPPPPTPAATQRDPVIAAAGDIVCGTASRGNACRDRQTADLLREIEPDVVLPLGDLQYETGTYADFINFYDLTWGKMASISRPVPGNHEYESPNARPYFDYFNGLSAFTGPAGDRDKGFYSFNLGEWHLIALNSECGRLGGCGPGSPQGNFLRGDLAANRRACTLAYWHHPLFSSGQNGNHGHMLPTWQMLYDAGVDVVLNGHDHSYERFAPQSSTRVAEPDRGIREFVVGTGGRNLTPFPTIQPNSEVRDNTSFGVLRMRLHSGSYDWRFFAITGMSLADQGAGVCH
jgi:hypothetical protein